jgi:phosphonate transport system substrate-binding protein
VSASCTRRVPLFALVVALPLACVTACSTGRAETVGTATTRPTVLRYCYAPNTEEPEKQSLRLDRLEKYLEDRLKIDVEMYKTSAGYGAVIEAMRAKKVDVAQIGPFGYLIASEKAGAEVLVVRGTKDTAEGIYSGVIAVAKNSPIKTIDQLVAHSKELTFSFVDPDSTSGFLVQRAYFQSVGLDPDTDFKKTMFSMNHIASAMTLIAGKVDAAAMMERMPYTLATRGRIKQDDIRILWTSPRLPSSPIAIRKDLPADFKEEVRQALVDIPDRDPELWKMWPKTNGPADAVLLPANDTLFDGLRHMVRSVDNLSLLEH